MRVALAGWKTVEQGGDGGVACSLCVRGSKVIEVVIVVVVIVIVVVVVVVVNLIVVATVV